MSDDQLSQIVKQVLNGGNSNTSPSFESRDVLENMEFTSEFIEKSNNKNKRPSFENVNLSQNLIHQDAGKIRKGNK
ncbi:TPA: hypothetical protein QCY63_002244 [Bacillus cereus]|nr:hypothetical protein [Bacillus cereus]